MEVVRNKDEMTFNLMQIRREVEQGITRPIVILLGKTKVTPNTLTIIGFIMTIVAAVLIGMGYLLGGGIMILVAGAFDMLDGGLARLKQQETLFGAFLDSVFDRFSEIALLLGVLVTSLHQYTVLSIMLVFIVLAGSMMISYVRARAEGLGLKGKAGWFTRPERIIVLAIGIIANRILIALIVLAFFTIITVIQRLVDVQKEAREKHP